MQLLIRMNNKNTEKVDSCAKLYLAGSSVSSIKQALGIGNYETIYDFLALIRYIPFSIQKEVNHSFFHQQVGSTIDKLLIKLYTTLLFH